MSESRVIITAQAEQAIAEFRRLQAQAAGSLREISNAGALSDNTLRRTTVSAGQTAAALRQVPAQFTDIIVSLQSGQAPLTVLLQQGGQLKDMFGGAAEAARGLGGYIGGLIGPVTVAAAVVGALAYAYHEGAAEAKAYTLALTMSGNAAGTTAGQLADVARRVSDVVGTQGAAAASLTALVATGRVASENLERFATVSIKGQRALGQSVADTAAEFADLGKTPVASLEKLNEKYHFLTGSVYEQVKALEMQGRGYEAGQVAQQAYATAFDGVSDRVTKNLGYMQKRWQELGDFAKGAWDKMLDVGREKTLAEKLAEVQKRLATPVPKALPNGLTAGRNEQRDADIAAETSLKNQIALEATKAALQADQARFNAADLEWSKTSFQYMSRQKQLETEIASERQKGLDAGRSDAEIEERLGMVRKKYSDIFNDSIDSQIAALNRRSAVADMISKRSLDMISFQRSAGMITEQQAIEQTTAIDLASFDQRKKAMQEELSLIRQKQNSRKDAADKQGEIDALEEERTSRKVKGENALFLLEQQRHRLAVDNAADLVDKAAGERNTLRQQLLEQKDYGEQIGATKVQLADLTAQRLREAAATKEQNAAILDTIVGREREAELLREQAQSLRDRAAASVANANKEQQFDEWKKAVDQYSDVFRTGFADMLNHGKDGWHSFTTSLVTTFKTTVADQIYKMFAQPFVVRMVASLLGVSGDATSMMMQGAGGSAGGAGGYVSIAQSAKSAYDAIEKGFTGLSTQVGSVVSSVGDFFGSSSMSAFGTGMGLDGAQAANAAQAYSNAGMQGTGSALTSGSSAGSALSIAGAWLAAAAIGRGIGNKISSGYSINGGNGGGFINFSTLTNSVPILGGIVGGLVNRAFGMREKETTAAGVRGTLSPTAFTGETFADWHQDGGWFRSDKNGTDTSAIDAATSKQFSTAYASITTAAADYAKTLGINADSIATRTQALNIKLTTDATANEKAVADFFAGVAQTITTELVPSIADFAKEGETASATFQRVAGHYAFLDTALAAIGTKFGALGVESIAARERLIDLTGGVDALGKGTAFFAANFLTEAERMAPIAAATAKTLGELGYASLNSRDDFKAAVQGLINSGALATEAGAKTFAGLMSVEEAFAQLHPALVDTAEAGRTAADILSERASLQEQLDRLELTDAQQRAKARLSVAADNLDLFDQITRKQEINAATDAFKGLYDSLKSNGEGVTNFMNSLKTGSLSTLTPMQRYLETQRQYDETLAKAKATPADSAAQTAAQTAATSFLTASQVINASSAAYVSDRAKVLGDMTSLSSIISTQMTDAQKQLALAGDQVTGIATLNTTALGIQQAIVSLGQGGAIVAPNFDAATYSGTADGRDVLVAEIKQLRALVGDLLKSSEGRRTDAQKQADYLADVTDKTADKIGASLAVATEKSEWRAKNATNRSPR